MNQMTKKNHKHNTDVTSSYELPLLPMYLQLGSSYPLMRERGERAQRS